MLSANAWPLPRNIKLQAGDIFAREGVEAALIPFAGRGHRNCLTLSGSGFFCRSFHGFGTHGYSRLSASRTPAYGLRLDAPAEVPRSRAGGTALWSLHWTQAQSARVPIVTRGGMCAPRTGAVAGLWSFHGTAHEDGRTPPRPRASGIWALELLWRVGTFVACWPALTLALSHRMGEGGRQSV